MRPGGGREVVVNAIPFDSTDHDNIRRYAEVVDNAFLPRPQGSQSAIAVGNRHPEISLPAVFHAFRTLLRKTGANWPRRCSLATREMTTDDAIAARDGENPTAAGHTRVSIRHLYHAGLWAAIRAGWRDGYNAEADQSSSPATRRKRSPARSKPAKRPSATPPGLPSSPPIPRGCLNFEADTRHPQSWSDAEIAERFEIVLDADVRDWMLARVRRPFVDRRARLRFQRRRDSPAGGEVRSRVSS